MPLIQDLVTEQNQLFFVLTETWLRDHSDAELSIDGYTLFRQDRKRQRKKMGRDSGGVAVYMKNNLAADMVTVASYSNGVIEFIGLSSKANNLLLLVMYRQPDDITGGNRSTETEFKQALGELENVLLSTQNPTPDILLCGDFNLPNANWTEGRAGPGAKKDEKTIIEDFITITNGYFLSQFIQKPTHKNGNTLDLYTFYK